MKIETSRRGFLGAAAGMAGLSAIGATPASAVVEPEPWGMKLVRTVRRAPPTTCT